MLSRSPSMAAKRRLEVPAQITIPSTWIGRQRSVAALVSSCHGQPAHLEAAVLGNDLLDLGVVDETHATAGAGVREAARELVDVARRVRRRKKPP